MASDLTSAILTGVLGSGALGAVLVFIKDRRKDTSDYTVATYKTLAEMNDRLETQVGALQVGFDAERALRRETEEKLARAERRVSHLEDQVARLEEDRNQRLDVLSRRVELREDGTYER